MGCANLLGASPNLVAQISNLLYRRIAFGNCPTCPVACGLQIRDTAQRAQPHNNGVRGFGLPRVTRWVGDRRKGMSGLDGVSPYRILVAALPRCASKVPS